jgi:hypothetical protein
MAMFGNFVPEVGQEVLIVNHLGTFRISGVDPEARSVSVTILRNGGALEGISWDQLCLLDKDLLDKALSLLNDSSLGGLGSGPPPIHPGSILKLRPAKF